MRLAKELIYEQRAWTPRTDLSGQARVARAEPRPSARDPNPLFRIDKVELEIAVRITKESGGQIKLSVLDFGFEGGKSVTREQGHVVKLSLTPLKDVVKGGEALAGQPE